MVYLSYDGTIQQGTILSRFQLSLSLFLTHVVQVLLSLSLFPSFSPHPCASSLSLSTTH
jgi:hypothetical protein